MEPFIGTLTSTEINTSAVNTTTTTAVTSTTATSRTSGSNGNVQAGDDDSNFDRLTQMLPECFVSVKLENNEDTCATEACTNTDSSQQDMSSECATESSAPLSEMQNSAQTSLATGSIGNRIAPSAHCFHHRGSMPELPPWLQHCYSSAQISSSDGTQQAAQYFHQSAAYLTHEGSIMQTDRSLKSNAGVARFDAAPSSGGIGGLSSGDICDSNTFLTYVLNQQRSSGIFLFDPIRSLHLESASDVVLHENENNTNPDCVHQKNTSDTSTKNSTPPSTIPPIEGNPTHRDAATNTLSKYPQTVSPVQLHADAKTNTSDYSDDSDTPSIPKQSNVSPLPHCKKCVVSKITQVCCGSNEQTISDEFVLDGPCQKLSNMKNYPPTGCVNQKPETKSENGKVGTNYVVVNTARCSHEGNHKHCACLNDNSRVIGQNVKAESISNSSFSNEDTNGKYNSVQLGQNIECKCTSDCDNTCLKDNQRVHYVDVDRPFTCEICLKNYHTSTALMNHMRYHRGQRPYQCEVCNKAFATNSHLVTHRRVHTGERPFQCRLCRRSFADRSAYVKHERTHGPNGTIIKRYKCEECGNAFVDSCGLKKHIRIHTGERPYCCSVCQKTFSTSSTFVAHKRIHSGERPYKCENCDKMFITKSHLLTHRRTHTGEKPFSCPVCNRAFADGSSFRRHERLHTGENRHTCDICGKGFPFDTSLAKHKQSHIPGTPTYVYMV